MRDYFILSFFLQIAKQNVPTDPTQSFVERMVP